MEIIVPIGIPGSGKTRLYKMKYSHLALVSVDDTYKEIINNKNDNKDIYKDVINEVDRKIDELIKKGESFYFDFVSVYTEYRKKFFNRFKDTDIKIIYVVLPADIYVSERRIKEDIKNNINRIKPSLSDIIWQYAMYRYSLKTKFEGENVQEIIYLKPEDLD